MKRAEFLKSLGLSGAAIMATYCLGGLTACSNEQPAPADPDNPNPSGGIDFTLDLNASANADLKNNGGFVYEKTNKIIVARSQDGNYVALASACTHQGIDVIYQVANNRFNCPAHNSNFSTTGSVLNGPASTPLKQYKTELNSTGNTLRVFEG